MHSRFINNSAQNGDKKSKTSNKQTVDKGQQMSISQLTQGTFCFCAATFVIWINNVYFCLKIIATIESTRIVPLSWRPFLGKSWINNQLQGKDTRWRLTKPKMMLEYSQHWQIKQCVQIWIQLSNSQRPIQYYQTSLFTIWKHEYFNYRFIIHRKINYDQESTLKE